MKKGLILFTALFLASSFAAFGGVTAVKSGDVVKVTWTYENDEAVSVGLVGDFQGWNLGGALPMTKVDGKWTVTLEGKADSEFKYKFNVDGEWTEDPAATNTSDDGFGGLNGYVIVADILNASSGATAGAAPAARGLTVGYMQASWAKVSAYTQSPTRSKKGLLLDKVSLHQKAYFKFDGYLYKDLLQTVGEIRLMDGAVDIYNMDPIYNIPTNAFVATEVTPWQNGLGNLAQLPYTFLNSFADNGTVAWDKSATLQGKFRAMLSLKDLNLGVSHSVGWSKGAKLGLGKVLSTIVGNEDSNAGITEVYNLKALDLGGATLDYYLNFDKSKGNYKNTVILWPTVAGIEFEVANTTDLAITDMETKITSPDLHTLVGASFKVADVALKVQGKYRYKVEATLTDAYSAGVSADYKAGDLSVYGDVFYTGADASTGYGATGDFNLAGDGTQNSHIDGNFKNSLSATYKFAPVSFTVTNKFWAAYKDFTAPGDEVTVSATYDNGIKITPEVKVTLPLDGADFLVNYVSLNAEQTGVKGSLYFIPNVDFTIMDVRAKVVYDLDANSSVLVALGTYFGSGIKSDDNMFGATLGYSAKTPFDAIKNPYLFVTADYNLNPMDGDDNYITKDIDDNAWLVQQAGDKSFADMRVGLRWNF